MLCLVHLVVILATPLRARTTEFFVNHAPYFALPDRLLPRKHAPGTRGRGLFLAFCNQPQIIILLQYRGSVAIAAPTDGDVGKEYSRPGHVFQSLVHDSACNDPVALARHQSFIGSHLLGGFLALAAFPIYLAAVGRPSLISALAFVWMMSPIAIAIFLSRTGRLGAAHLVSAINLTGLVIFAAGLTGGVTSFLVVWMIVVPLEAALSGDRRVVLGGIAIACAGIVILGAGSILNALPEARSLATDPVLMAFLASVSALVYAGGLAVSVQIIHRRSEDAIRQGEARYQLLADNATDMITRHDPDGDVVFASAASLQLVGKAPQSLLGDACSSGSMLPTGQAIALPSTGVWSRTGRCR